MRSVYVFIESGLLARVSRCSFSIGNRTSIPKSLLLSDLFMTALTAKVCVLERKTEPMLTLFLLRHAKSSWEDATLDDYDRSLNARGKRSAPAIGRYMAQKAYAPNLILCSGSHRTRETLGLVLPYLHGDQEIRVEEGLYHARDEAR